MAQALGRSPWSSVGPHGIDGGLHQQQRPGFEGGHVLHGAGKAGIGQPDLEHAQVEDGGPVGRGGVRHRQRHGERDGYRHQVARRHGGHAGVRRPGGGPASAGPRR